ncbi:MAG: hypothetical protein MUC82_07150 [Cypionkella sp.]|jgi:hypothetical protein|nr:hypothetical protein [Cypionkella sp.]
MSPSYKATLPARLLVLIGVAMNAAVVLLKIGGTIGPMLHILGGLIALAGLIWFWRAARRT